MTQNDILRAAELLQDADALIIAAGAGMGEILVSLIFVATVVFGVLILL